MPLPLPKSIEVFMSSENTHNTDALAECFALDATVQDEGQTLKGLKAIKAWRLVPPTLPSWIGEFVGKV